jgi:hypothetical protein
VCEADYLGMGPGEWGREMMVAEGQQKLTLGTVCMIARDSQVRRENTAASILGEGDGSSGDGRDAHRQAMDGLTNFEFTGVAQSLYS